MAAPSLESVTDGTQDTRPIHLLRRVWENHGAALEARIEKKLVTHDDAIAAMLSAIRQLMNAPPPKRRPIGFTANLDEK
jgi:hypothetical protein